VEKAAASTLKRLHAYEERIIETNAERRKRAGAVTFEWMLPSEIQTSLNI
jgi:hypothetical protein